MKTVRRFAFLAAIATTTIAISILNTSLAQALVLFDNGASNLEAVVPSDRSPSYPGLMLEGGDDFSFSSAANITKVTWSGIHLFGITPLTDAFSVGLSNIVNGVPDLNPFATLNGSLSRIDSGLDVDPDATLYNYALTLTTPFSVRAGNYLLSIVNNTTDDPDDNWAWAISNFNGSAYNRVNPGDAWENFPTEMSFKIEGNTTQIPTPALLPGLIAFGASVLRQRKKMSA
ncbi:PTPA-CTERM sorting domain-containing protein [Phormidesmis priestleyi]